MSPSQAILEADTAHLLGLYREYDDELRLLARRLREIFHVMQHQAHGTTFGDVEGECLYMLLREMRPETVFEISPAAGWSSNYILAALTANQKGMLHSFEIEATMGGEPAEAVIRRNQHPAWDLSRFQVHIGDARTNVDRVPGPIDFLLLDSCHEDWFANWYISTLFPRVNGRVLVQDIAFVDQMEPSSEARQVWTWLREQRVRPCLLGAVEVEVERAELRRGYAERRVLRSNAILLNLLSPSLGDPPELDESPGSLIDRAEAEAEHDRPDAADDLLNEAVYRLLRDPTRGNRHRLLCRVGRCYARIGQPREGQRAFQRALGIVLQADRQQRVKGLRELVELFATQGRWSLATQAAFVLSMHAGSPRLLAGAATTVARASLRKILRGVRSGPHSPLSA